MQPNTMPTLSQRASQVGARIQPARVAASCLNAERRAKIAEAKRNPRGASDRLLSDLLGFQSMHADAIRARVRDYVQPRLHKEITDSAKFALLDSYVMALSPFPQWAVELAFEAVETESKFLEMPARFVSEIKTGNLDDLLREVARRKRIEEERMEETKKSERKLVTPEQAARILAEFGVNPEKDVLKTRRFPTASTMEEIETKIAENQKAAVSGHWSDTASPDDPRWAALYRARAASLSVAVPVPEAPICRATQPKDAE